MYLPRHGGKIDFPCRRVFTYVKSPFVRSSTSLLPRRISRAFQPSFLFVRGRGLVFEKGYSYVDPVEKLRGAVFPEMFLDVDLKFEISEGRIRLVCPE